MTNIPTSDPASDRVIIRVYYDFASTLCYVAHRVLSEVESQLADAGIELEWRPLDLTMIVPWNRGDSFADEVRDNVHDSALSLGIDVEMPDPWLDSRPASTVALMAASQDTKNHQIEAQWRSAVFESIFEQRRFDFTPKLSQLASELLGATVSDDGEDFEQIEQSTSEAVLLGVNGVPAFVLDDLLFGGIYDGEAMVKGLSELVKLYQEAGSSTVN